MKKYIALTLMLLSGAVLAAVFGSFDQLETEIKNITYIKQAVDVDGNPVIVTKFEGTIQDMTVRTCKLFWPNKALNGTATETLSTVFESFNDYETRSPEVPLGANESLCWPVWITAIWLDTTSAVAINLTTNEALILEPNLRCDTNRPFDGGGRTGDYSNWYHLRVATNDSPIVAHCIEQVNANATISYNEPTTNRDGTVLNDLAGIKVYYHRETRNNTSRHLVATIPASSPQGGQRITKDIFVPIVGRTNLVALAYDFDSQKSRPSNLMPLSVAVKWKDKNTMLASN